jgi:hypothetical protein
MGKGNLKKDTKTKDEYIHMYVHLDHLKGNFNANPG